jgi:alkaline phosphatase D
MGGHGYSVVYATSAFLETEFVCIPRPVERSDRPDGCALSFRVKSRTDLWEDGEAPKLQILIPESDPNFSV